MKTVSILAGLLLLALTMSHPERASGADITVTGNIEISKGVSITENGKAVRYPDGTIQRSAPIKYSKTLVISPGGTPAENGIALLDAVLAITDATGSNLYLIHLEPGTYDIAAESLVMKSYVSIEGSGADATLIRGSASGSEKGVVIGAFYCRLKDVTIEHTGGGTHAIGIYNKNASPELTNLSVKVSNGDVNYAIYNKYSAPTINRVSCIATGTLDISCGIYNEAGNPTYIMNVTSKASGSHNNYGIWNRPGSSTILRHISLEATGGTDCYGLRNDNSTCDMIFIDAAASGGSNLNAGVFNSFSTVSMFHLTAASSGGVNNNYGIYNSLSSIVMNNVKATASGASNAHGIYNNMSDASFTNVHAQALGATSKSAGMTNAPHAGTGSYLLSVDRSSFSGTNYSISSNSKYTMNIGLSRLEGPITAEGTWHCVACFNASNADLGANCQPLP
jgi:hypothetical protein